MTSRSKESNTYTQGYSSHTTSTHQLRTASTDFAFLLPYLKPSDHILDIGCGPGTITTSLLPFVPQGRITGVDMSAPVLQKARHLASEAGIPTEGPGSVVFEEGNVLEGLHKYADETFDVVFASHVFGHIPPPDLPVKALRELRRVLKAGGILATRDAAAQHFYPSHLAIDHLWVKNQLRAIYKAGLDVESTGQQMPSFFRRAGFDVEGGKVKVGSGSSAMAEPEKRKWLARRAEAQLSEGDEFRRSWLEVGVGEAEIEETVRAAWEWAETDDAWFGVLYSEMLGWK